jgi:hypothetical protein
VRTQITLRPSTSAVCKKSSGHDTTTSSALGNRSRVANTGRASQTVTRYPMNLPIFATAPAKSIAPKTYIFGGGANELTKTVTSSIRRCPRGP